MNLGNFFKEERKLFKNLPKLLTFGVTKSHLPQKSNFSNVFPSFLVTTKASWRNLSNASYLLACYYDNPVVQAVINVKAEAFANMKFIVEDSKTGELIPLDQYDADGGKLRQLLAQPNPLQSSLEWLKQIKVNREVFSDAYAYASLPVGFENIFTYQDINVINNLPPYLMAPVLTGKWLDETELNDIIKHYELRAFNGFIRKLNTNTVFHTNGVNIRLNAGFTEGVSKLIALQRPITNIEKAFESKNVLIEKRGAIGAWISDKKDESTGSAPLSDTELEEVQKAFKNYGLLDDQYQQIISPSAIKWQQTVMDVKKLMLFEEIESDAIAICNSYGVPEGLVRYYIRKGSLGVENNKDEKRLYDSTIIPESKDFMITLNNFLKTQEHDIKLIGSFDHLKVLQENEKEAAETTKIKEGAALSAFKIGAIIYNDYLKAIDLPQDDDIGELRVWDLSPAQLNAIGIMINTNAEKNTTE